MKLFLTDYASYNNGSQFEFGHWIDLDQFDDAEAFSEYVTKHLKECDKKSPIEGSAREEPMYTDYEGFPESFYSESMGPVDLEKLFAYKALDWDDKDDDDKVSLWNEYCDANNIAGDIWQAFDEEFFNVYFVNNPMDAARAVSFGEVDWSHEYIKFDGYGNLESTNDPISEIDEDALLEWMLEQV